jgi:hypothetical protein
MPSGLEQLLHDAAALHRFVEGIHQFCSQQRSAQTYIRPTTDFFAYLEQLAQATKGYICQLATTTDLSPGGITLARKDLQHIKSYWRILHAFIKPAADAHVLQLPTPLINFAASQFKTIEGMSGSEVVVLLTPELMYFQTPHTELKQTASDLAQIIPEAKFPEGLGFVELPYSQGLNLFTNLALYHELGHFAFEELRQSEAGDEAIGKLDLAIKQALKEALKARLAKDYDTLPANTKASIVRILWNWTQEVFADLVALRLAGPAFTFALIEVFNLLGLQDEPQQVKFNESHPSSALRLNQHLELLKDEGWWDTLKDLDAGHRELLEELAGKAHKSTLYLDGKPAKVDPGFVAAFRTVLPEIRSLVAGITINTGASATEFTEARDKIERALMSGVVPSCFWKEDATAAPHPIAVMNAAFCCYLTKLPALMEGLQDQSAADVKVRSFWTQRLEAWTLKAVEDYSIIQKYESIQHEHSVRKEN